MKIVWTKFARDDVKAIRAYMDSITLPERY